MIAAGSHCQVSADSPSTAAAILALDLQGPFAHPHGELETELADLETQKRISEELEALKTSSGQATA